MSLKKVIFMLLIAVFCLSAGGVSAQDDPVRVIPVGGLIARVRLSSDGQTIAVFEDMNAQGNMIDPLYLPLRLIDVATGEERMLIGHTDFATDVTFTPDSTRLISYHANGYIMVWDVASGKLEKQIPGVIGPMRLFMLPDGKTLAVLANINVGQVWLWDIETGFITGILADRPSSYGSMMEQLDDGGLSQRFLTLAVSPDGTQLATVDFNSTVKVWDIATSKATLLRQGAEDDYLRFNIRYVQFMPDGETLLVHSYADDMVHIWDIASASEIQTITVAEKAHLTVSADASRIAWISPEDNTLVVADMDQPDNQTVIALPANDLEYAPFMTQTLFFADNQIVFSSFLASDGENQIYVIDLPN